MHEKDIGTHTQKTADATEAKGGIRCNRWACVCVFCGGSHLIDVQPVWLLLSCVCMCVFCLVLRWQLWVMFRIWFWCWTCEHKCCSIFHGPPSDLRAAAKMSAADLLCFFVCVCVLFIPTPAKNSNGAILTIKHYVWCAMRAGDSWAVEIEL